VPLFPVPKFIERETPIVGPLTLKQFIFLLVAAVSCFILYKILPFFIFLPLCLIIVAFSLSFAFLKVGEIPFYQVFLDGLKFFFGPKRFSWSKKGVGKPTTFKEMELKKEEKFPIKVGRESKLKETITKIETKK
jgi:hypothetical protein